MEDKDLARLRHMFDSVNAILSFVDGRDRTSLDTDRLLLPGIIRELEIVGEAAGRVSEPTQSRFPQVPWKQVIGMRNRLIHAYFDIDHDILWKTIQKSLPPLSKQLQSIISEK